MLILSDRNHWSLFPVVFDGRHLPSDVYDELMGTLMHGCVGEPVSPTLGFYIPISDIVDVITSRSSTLPYDDDTMRRMIQLVQAAKGTPVGCKEENDC